MDFVKWSVDSRTSDWSVSFKRAVLIVFCTLRTFFTILICGPPLASYAADPVITVVHRGEWADWRLM
jgi:hypothetical protein